MTIERLFLVSVSHWREDAPLDDCARSVREVLAESYRDETDRQAIVTAVPLPDLGENDFDLQRGFRKLVEAERVLMSDGQNLHSPPISAPEVRALIAAISKQPAEKTADVEVAALDAMREVRELITKWMTRRMLTVQRDARIQLVITDAIVRCLQGEKRA